MKDESLMRETQGDGGEERMERKRGGVGGGGGCGNGRWI